MSSISSEQSLTVRRGVVAAGHPETVASALEVLEDGGNAFDAAVAAQLTACVSEPVLTSLGGGGFLLAAPADTPPRVYDFFVHTPRARAAEPDFYPIHANFGPATQEFHIGMAAMATPGMVHGLFEIHRDLCRLPFKRLAERAIASARDGVPISPFQEYLFSVVSPILTVSSGSRSIFCDPAGTPLSRGARFVNPDFADALEALAAEGPRLFYAGEIGARLARDAASGGGCLSRDDLLQFETLRKAPLQATTGNHRLLLNPPPSSGGALVALGMELLAGEPAGRTLPARVLVALQGMERVRRLRATPAAMADHLPAGLRAALDESLGGTQQQRGTTHISVIDADGNVAALTSSNGEGTGYVIPGTGIMMNNMLGEEDVNPGGGAGWPLNQRLRSMMCPACVRHADGPLVALGSGGSNRIRSAVLQVLAQLLVADKPLPDAVNATRLHFENGLLSVEGGDTNAADPALRGDFQRQDWPERNLFFGGVHAASLDPATGRAQAAGDPRRGGACGAT
ncbi:MAG: gamma-glutamyltransferase [Gammaproteobacteria bacterium]|nr:gamma-glutamyltransferase [Gammaproteobacteria bacterium]